MVLHSPMEKARKRSNQKLVNPSLSASSSSPVILRPFSSSYPLLSSLWSMATHALIIYAAQVAWNFTVSYIILAHTFLYTWTRVCYTWPFARRKKLADTRASIHDLCRGKSILCAWIIAGGARVSRACASDTGGLYFFGRISGGVNGGGYSKNGFQRYVRTVWWRQRESSKFTS